MALMNFTERDVLWRPMEWAWETGPYDRMKCLAHIYHKTSVTMLLAAYVNEGRETQSWLFGVYRSDGTHRMIAQGTNLPLLLEDIERACQEWGYPQQEALVHVVTEILEELNFPEEE